MTTAVSSFLFLHRAGFTGRLVLPMALALLMLSVDALSTYSMELPLWDSSQTPVEGPPETPTRSENPESQDVYNAGVTVVKELPPLMYGVWSIQGRIIKTDHPAFAPISTEIWELARGFNTVTIENVVNQARASITVDAVQGNTASFHRVYKSQDGRFRIIERPTITVEGNFLTGKNLQTYTYYFRDGSVRAEYFVEAQLSGTRLAQESYQFKALEGPPQFEIEPLKVIK
jgi:hypothetical protein